MLNLKENRDDLIKRVIESIKESERRPATDSIIDFEYEPSEIINALFETRVSPNNFKHRKLEIVEESFFPNSSSYIKNRGQVTGSTNEIKGDTNDQ